MPRTVVTALQNQTPVDLSGIEVDGRPLTVDGRTSPCTWCARPAPPELPVFMFFHGAVWIAGNFENHKRSFATSSSAPRQWPCSPSTPRSPEAQFPVQIEQAYAATVWVNQHGAELGVDGSRLAVTGNSVGGNVAAAVTLMAHDRGSPNIVYQQLLWPALSAELDTESYGAYGEGRFLPRAFMQYGWDHYAPDPETRKTATPRRYGPPPSNCEACHDPHPDRCERRAARRRRGLCPQPRRRRRRRHQRPLQRHHPRLRAPQRPRRRPQHRHRSAPSRRRPRLPPPLRNLIAPPVSRPDHLKRTRPSASTVRWSGILGPTLQTELRVRSEPPRFDGERSLDTGPDVHPARSWSEWGAGSRGCWVSRYAPSLSICARSWIWVGIVSIEHLGGMHLDSCGRFAPR